MLNLVDIFSFLVTVFSDNHVDLASVCARAYKFQPDNYSIILEFENFNNVSIKGASHVKVVWHDEEYENQSDFELNESFIVHSFEKVFITMQINNKIFSSMKTKGALFIFNIEEVGNLEVFIHMTD